VDTAALATSEPGTVIASNAGGRDRRVDDRFDLNRAAGSLLYKGTRIPCEVLDVSLSGCRLRVLQPLNAGPSELVKVTLTIADMVLSIWGVTQWITADRLAGIRFTHPTERTRDEVAGALMCLLELNSAAVVKTASAENAVEAGIQVVVQADLPRIELESASSEDVPEEEFQMPPPPPPPPKRPELQSEYEVLSLEEDESPVTLHLVAEGSSLAGSVLDVSQDGCLVLLARPVVVRVNAQAEVDFRLHGLSLRLPGTTRQMPTDQMVEIRFAEMNSRKRQDLAQAITELILRGKAAGATH
jgi:hypothetical protein